MHKTNMIVTLIMVIWTLSSTEAGILIQEVDSDLDGIKDRLSDVEKNLASMVKQMNEAKRRLDNLEEEDRTACRDGWMAFKGSCYFFGTANVKFDEAEDICEGVGAYLVHVENQEENEFLKDFMFKHSDLKVHYWLGITDIENEGVWKMTGTQNTTAPFFDWGTKYTEPGGGMSENCVIFSSFQEYRWADVPCTSTFRYLCEQN